MENVHVVTLKPKFYVDPIVPFLLDKFFLRILTNNLKLISEFLFIYLVLEHSNVIGLFFE